MESSIKFFAFFLLSSLLFSETYPSFTQKELLDIEKKKGSISKNRIVDYEKTLKRVSSFSKYKQLTSINFYLNQLLPQYDDVINKKEDHWATPKEFLTTGYGDCEDYVIIKYFSLIKLGFDEKKLFITVVKETYYGGYHMVLTYFQEENESPLVLDNLSFKILNLQTRNDIKADIFINSTGVYKMKDKKLVKFAHNSKKYLELLESIKKEK